jgi:excisionase family DNA binding protein
MANSHGTDAEPLWKAAQVARALAISTRTVYIMSQRGELPSVKIGRSVRWDPRAVRQWISNGGTGKASTR